MFGADRFVYWTMCEADPQGSALTFSLPLETIFSTEEIERINGLRFPKRRWEWMFGRITGKQLLKVCETSCIGKSLPKIRIENEPEGAPYAMVENQIVPGCLTISHSGRFAMAAHSPNPGLQIGVDLEQVEHRAESFLFDFFTPAEVRIAQSLPDAVRDTWITIAWSAKESVLKAIRKGLRLDTRMVEIGQAESLMDGGQFTAWKPLKLGHLPAFSGHWAAWWRCQGRMVQTMVVWDQRETQSFQPVLIQEVRVKLLFAAVP